MTHLTPREATDALCAVILDDYAQHQAERAEAMRRHPSNACDDCGDTSPCARCVDGARRFRLIDGGK